MGLTLCGDFGGNWRDFRKGAQKAAGWLYPGEGCREEMHIELKGCWWGV